VLDHPVSLPTACRSNQRERKQERGQQYERERFFDSHILKKHFQNTQAFACFRLKLYAFARNQNVSRKGASKESLKAQRLERFNLLNF
jgi:hypothetical protein